MSVKKLLVGLLVLALVWLVITQPDTAASILLSIWNIITDVLSSVGRFFSQLV